MDRAFGYYDYWSQFSAMQWCIFIALSLLTYAATWMLYEKAGKPGWAAIVPFYNDYVMAKILYGQGWMFLLQYVPVVNIVYIIVTMYKFAKCYTDSTGIAIGTIFLPFVFLPILGFGDAKFEKKDKSNTTE